MILCSRISDVNRSSGFLKRSSLTQVTFAATHVPPAAAAYPHSVDHARAPFPTILSCSRAKCCHTTHKQALHAPYGPDSTPALTPAGIGVVCWARGVRAVTAFSCRAFSTLRSVCSARLLLPLRAPAGSSCKPHRSVEEGFRKAFRLPVTLLL